MCDISLCHFKLRLCFGLKHVTDIPLSLVKVKGVVYLANFEHFPLVKVNGIYSIAIVVGVHLHLWENRIVWHRVHVLFISLCLPYSTILYFGYQPLACVQSILLSPLLCMPRRRIQFQNGILLQSWAHSLSIETNGQVWTGHLSKGRHSGRGFGIRLLALWLYIFTSCALYLSPCIIDPFLKTREPWPCLQ